MDGAPSQPQVVVFPDTNMFLHFRWIDELPWGDLVGTKDVEIAIAPVVLRELAKHKRGHDPDAVRQRARDRLARLVQVLRGDAKEHPPSLLRITRAGRLQPEGYAKHGLERDEADDQLLGAALRRREESPGARIAAATADGELQLAAPDHGLEVVVVPDEYALRTEDEKLVVKREERIREREEVGPKLRLTFADGDRRTTVRVPHPPRDAEAHKRRLMDAQRRRHGDASLPTGGPRDPSMCAQTLEAAAASVRWTQEVARRVGRQFTAPGRSRLDAYYGEYEQYLDALVEFSQLRSRFAVIHLRIANDGTRPGERVQVDLSLPEGFRFMEERDWPRAPAEPKAPDPAELRAEPWETGALARILRDGGAAGIPDRLTVANAIPRNVGGPYVDEDDASQAWFRIDLAMHETSIELPPLGVLLPANYEKSGSAIGCKVSAVNLSHAVSGDLNVSIERGDPTGLAPQE